MLRFRLFGFPVGVHATFLLVVFFLRPSTLAEGAIALSAAFGSILLHELGHALVARTFGGQGISITLFAFGGLTSFSHGSNMTHGRSFLVSAAGSAIGIVAGVVALGVLRSGVATDLPDALITFLIYFTFTALGWGILNWVPIVPLDGGHMVQHAISMFDEERAPFIGQIVTWISVGGIVLFAIGNPVFLWFDMRFAAVMVIVIAALGLRNYRAQRPAATPAVEPDAIEPAPPARPTPPEPPPEFPI